MGFTHLFGRKGSKRSSADFCTSEKERERQGLFSLRGVKRRRVSTEPLRSSNDTTPLPSASASITGDDDSDVAVSTRGSATASSSDDSSEECQPKRKSSVFKYCKTLLFRRHDSHQAQAGDEYEDNTPIGPVDDNIPLDPLDQAYQGQLSTVNADQLLEKPDGPSTYWKKSPQFKSTFEKRERRESTWSTESTWDLQEPATSPFSSPYIPEPLSESQSPHDRIRWAPISWVPPKLLPRRFSEKRRGKKPQPPSKSVSPDQTCPPVLPLPAPSAKRPSNGPLMINFDARKVSPPVAMSSATSTLAGRHMTRAVRASNTGLPVSPHLGPTEHIMSIPVLDLEESRTSVDGSRMLSGEMMFHMSPFDSESQSDTDVSIDSEQASVFLDEEEWPPLRRVSRG